MPRPRQQIVAYLGELNHDQHRRWQRTVVFHNAKRDAAAPTVSGTILLWRCLMIPTWCAFGSARSVGPTRGILVTCTWHDALADAAVGRDRGPSCAAGQTHREAGGHRGHRGDQSACARRAASSLWPSTGMPRRRWKSCWVCPTPRSPRIACTARSTRSAKRRRHRERPEEISSGRLFHLEYDLLLYDLTSTYFEGLAEENDVGERGYSRRSSERLQGRCSWRGRHTGRFPVSPLHAGGQHAGRRDRGARLSRWWNNATASGRGVVMDRGMVSRAKLRFLSRPGRRYVIGLAPYRGRTLSKGTRNAAVGSACPNGRRSRSNRCSVSG